MEKSVHEHHTPINAPASASSAPNMPPAPEKEEKIARTPGLKIFDVFLYPFLTNFAVFAISVGATYLTAKGGQKNAKGKPMFGVVGEWFQSRGDWLKSKLMTHTGMNSDQADMWKMVTFSFADGSIMAPVIKWFEDRREKIGRAIDVRLGTCPEDDAAYAAEPKQSWLSILGGRLATVSIVVPTALLLDKKGLNNVLFKDPGHAMGEWFAKKPAVTKVTGNLDLAELGKTSLFEAFYTSVCTAGIYISSRMIARFQGKNKASSNEQASPAAPAPIETPSAVYVAPPDLSRRERASVGAYTKRVNAEPALPLARF